MQISEARWVVSIAGLLALILTGVYCVKLVRDMALGGSGDSLVGPEEYLSKFQKLRDEGKLAPEEFAKLAGLEPDFEPADPDPRESSDDDNAENDTKQDA